MAQNSTVDQSTQVFIGELSSQLDAGAIDLGQSSRGINWLG